MEIYCFISYCCKLHTFRTLFDTMYLCVCLCVCKIFERILFIWAIRHPASGYVQGINDLVTPFFVVYVFEYIGKFHLPELLCYMLLMWRSAFVLQELLSSMQSWTFCSWQHCVCVCGGGLYRNRPKSINPGTPRSFHSFLVNEPLLQLCNPPPPLLSVCSPFI